MTRPRGLVNEESILSGHEALWSIMDEASWDGKQGKTLVGHEASWSKHDEASWDGE